MRIIQTFESFSQLNEKNPCWKGYKQVGTKMKNGKEVPNCVPIKESEGQTVNTSKIVYSKPDGEKIEKKLSWDN